MRMEKRTAKKTAKKTEKEENNTRRAGRKTTEVTYMNEECLICKAPLEYLDADE